MKTYYLLLILMMCAGRSVLADVVTLGNLSIDVSPEWSVRVNQEGEISLYTIERAGYSEASVTVTTMPEPFSEEEKKKGADWMLRIPKNSGELHLEKIEMGGRLKAADCYYGEHRVRNGPFDLLRVGYVVYNENRVIVVQSTDRVQDREYESGADAIFGMLSKAAGDEATDAEISRRKQSREARNLAFFRTGEGEDAKAGNEVKDVAPEPGL